MIMVDSYTKVLEVSVLEDKSAAASTLLHEEVSWYPRGTLIDLTCSVPDLSENLYDDAHLSAMSSYLNASAVVVLIDLHECRTV